MSKKRTIDEIIESIFKLVNQAKNKGNEISYSPSEKTIEAIKSVNLKNKRKQTVLAKKDLKDIKIVHSKKNQSSDWSNIKFNKNFDRKNIYVKKKIKGLIEKRVKEKFEIEIGKWVEKRIPKLLEIELKKKTKMAYKKK